MIEKMKVVHIVAAQTQKTELLDALRALGIVHFAEKADADQTYLERFAALSRLITVLEEQGGSEVEAETLDDDQFKVLFDELNACLERKKALEAERAAAVSACDTLAGWGSFSPAEIKELKAQGFELHFCRVDKKLLASLEADKEVRFLRLAPVGKQQTVAILGALPASCAAGEFIPPEKSLDEYRQEIADCERGLSECGAQLKAAAKHLPSFREQLLKTQNDADYSSVRNTSESGDGLVWLTGYLPVDEAERFKAAAAKDSYAAAVLLAGYEKEKAGAAALLADFRAVAAAGLRGSPRSPVQGDAARKVLGAADAAMQRLSAQVNPKIVLSVLAAKFRSF